MLWFEFSFKKLCLKLGFAWTGMATRVIGTSVGFCTCGENTIYNIRNLRGEYNRLYMKLKTGFDCCVPTGLIGSSGHDWRRVGHTGCPGKWARAWVLGSSKSKCFDHHCRRHDCVSTWNNTFFLWDYEMCTWQGLFLKIPLHQSIKSLSAIPGEQMNVQGWEVLAAGLSHLHNSHREQLVLFRLHIFSKWPLLAYFLWALDRFRSKVGQATLCIFVSYFIVCQQCCHPCWTFHKLGCLLCLKVDWGCSYLHINLRKHNRQTINSPIWMYPVYTLFQYWIFIIVYLQNWVKIKLNLCWFVYLGLSIDWLRCQACKTWDALLINLNLCWNGKFKSFVAEGNLWLLLGYHLIS